MDLVDRIRSNQEITTPILPYGCRILRQVAGKRRFFIERPPAVVEARIQQYLGQASSLTFTVVMPWQLYVITERQGQYDRPRCFWLRGSLTDPSDPILRFTTPNMETSASGIGCLGASFVPPVGCTPDTYARYVVNHIYNSSYNLDLTGRHMSEYTPADILNIAIPGDYRGLPADSFTNEVSKFFARWEIWSAQALNPKIDVCELAWDQSGTFQTLLSESL